MPPSSLQANPQTPPFLLALQSRASNLNPTADPDRHDTTRARRSRKAEEDVEDGAVVLDDAGREVGVFVGGVLKPALGNDSEGEKEEKSVEGQGLRREEDEVKVGAGRKRKVGRVVGGGDEAGGEGEDGKEETENEEGSKAGKAEQPAVKKAKTSARVNAPGKGKTAGKVKAKAKGKGGGLSFSGDEDG